MLKLVKIYWVSLVNAPNVYWGSFKHVDPFGGLFKWDVEIPFMYIVFLWYLAVAFFTVF